MECPKRSRLERFFIMWMLIDDMSRWSSWVDRKHYPGISELSVDFGFCPQTN